MSDVTLSSAVRSSLLSLQNTTVLIDRTQGRLSTGLRVASSIDDPVAFFQAKSLNDRAFDSCSRFRLLCPMSDNGESMTRKKEKENEKRSWCG